MTITTHTTFNVLFHLVAAICIILLFLSAVHFAQPHFTSVGWHDLASIGWNG